MTRPYGFAASLHPGRYPILPVLVLVAGCVVQALYGYAHADRYGHAWGLDDAFISYRYAQNLYEGKGLVFNEGARVEGYSNFLYVLLTAPAFLFTRGMGVYAWATVLNVLFAAAALVLWHRRMRQDLSAPLLAIGSLLLALWPPLWAAAASGMETALVLLVQVAVWALLTSPRGAGRKRQIVLLACLLVASVLLRADGFLLALLVVPYLPLRGRSREAGVVLSIVFAAAGAYLLWRYSYYGGLAPNTYYVKISGPITQRLSQAARQLLDAALHGGLLPYLLALLVAAASLAARAWKGGHAPRTGEEGLVAKVSRGGLAAALGGAPFELWLSLGTLAYWLFIGGDALGDRFLLPIVPMGLAILLRQLPADGRSGSHAILVLLVASLTLAPLRFDARFGFTSSKHDLWVALGRHLRERHAGETLAVDAAGKIPFLSGLRTLDMLGLNEPEIARKQVDFFSPGHSKHDADYVLAKRPDLIAAFIDPYNLDMSYGLWRVKYEAAGYRLLYLVNGEKDLGPGTILSVAGIDRDEIRRRILEGYFYAVLRRS